MELSSILIVEDDFTIAKEISQQLASWGYEPHTVTDFADPMSEFTVCNPSLVLMDITLPFFNGFLRCEKIRQVSKVPIIFLSSASDNLNMITALNMGGDDFVAKPFDINVLLAKIKALLRRTYEMTSSDSALISLRGAVYDAASSSLTYNGTKIELTKNENRIINVLLTHKGSIVSRTRLMEYLWEDDSFVDENTLNVNVNRLRKKLEEKGLTDLILTKKGQGYIIEE